MSLAATARMGLSRDDLAMRAGVVCLAAVLLLIVGLPLWALLAKGFEDRDGNFVGLANYLSYFSTPALFDSALNSFHVAAAVTVIVEAVIEFPIVNPPVALVAVSTRSPRPESPMSVSGFAPSALPNRVNSAKLRASRAARALSPRPMPSTIPQAMA